MNKENTNAKRFGIIILIIFMISCIILQTQIECAYGAVSNKNKAGQNVSYSVLANGLSYSVRNMRTGAMDYSSTDGTKVINYALNHLTANRNWNEEVLIQDTVYVTGSGELIPGLTREFALIIIPSYTSVQLIGRVVYSGQDAQSLAIFASGYGSTNVNFFGGTIDGNGNVQFGILFNGVSSFSIHDSNLSNVRQAGAYIQVESSSFGNIYSNKIDGHDKGVGINVLDYSHDIAVAKNTFDRTWDTFVDVSEAASLGGYVERISVTDNVGFKTKGIGYGYAVHNRVRDVVFKNNVANLYDSSYDGISIVKESSFTRPSEITIRGNTLLNSGRYGVKSDGINVKILENEILDSMSSGVLIQENANSNTISNNFISSSKPDYMGINLGGTTGSGCIFSSINVIGNKVISSGVSAYGLGIYGNNVVVQGNKFMKCTNPIYVDGLITVLYIANNKGLTDDIRP